MTQKTPVTAAFGEPEGIGLRTVDQRGTLVWPGGMGETFVTDSDSPGFQPKTSSASQAVSQARISAPYRKVTAPGLRYRQN